MKTISKNIKGILILLSFLMILSCHKGSTGLPPPIANSDTTVSNANPTDHEDTLPVFSDDLPPTDNSIPSLTITWEKQAKRISTGATYNASYPRVHKLGGDTLLMTYLTSSWGGFHGNVILRRSIDNGQSWSDPREIVKYESDRDTKYFGFKNPDFIMLKNGWILLAYIGLGRPDFSTNDVQIIFSMDRGETWTQPRIINKGASWEPAMVQLSDGTIDMFISSEAKWYPVPGVNVQQEILMMSSKDNGMSWSDPITAAYSPGNRDGMAVPLLLKDNKGIVFPIESPGQKMPWIFWSSVKANFYYNNYGTVENGRRWYIDPPPIASNGGAPYLVQLPTGETLLNEQAAAGRNVGAEWKKSTQIVLVGNSVAKNFTNASIAWPDLAEDEGTYFSSICVLDNNTILSVVSRFLSNSHTEIWAKAGHIHR